MSGTRQPRAANRFPKIVPNARLHEKLLKEQLYSTSIGIHFVNDLKSASKAIDFAKMLVFIERLCDNSDSSRGPFEYSLNMSLLEVLERPHICCERTPIGWNEDPFFERNNILDALKQGYCRSITHFADFVAVSPELFNEFLQDLVEYLYTNVATAFQEIQITAEEYALLKTIVIFSGGNDLIQKANECGFVGMARHC
ncbi:unnamed protein product [Haemonchus placei]|uniref:NR LBD domain-containing protein n=1 Tax=Haemonchus placei TaxID=6290 RepID=A0A158QKJ6_HAEPC|nr:unnamed protein product [Haemonchus placei]